LISIGETKRGDGSDASSNGIDTLSGIPDDAYIMVCEALDMYDIARLCVVNHHASSQVELMNNRVLSLSLYRWRHWSDSNILRLISRYKNITSLSFKKCKQFSSFVAIPSAAPLLQSLNLAGCTSVCIQFVCPLYASLMRCAG
jgi:hypothetical protein